MKSAKWTSRWTSRYGVNPLRWVPQDADIDDLELKDPRQNAEEVIMETQFVADAMAGEVRLTQRRVFNIVPVSAKERWADREPPEFWPLPEIVGPHLAAWNGESWDVVALPDGDCGVHDGNGAYCLKCAATALWAKQQPTPREARGASKPSHPWRKGLPTVEPLIESFRRRVG